MDVLGHAAAYDNRTASRAEATAWSAALPNITPGAAIDAVVAWYGEHRERVMPADVAAHVRGTQADRHPSSRPLSEVIADLPEVPEVPSLAAQAAKAKLARIIAGVSARLALPAGDDEPADRKAAG
jgi:hypothetical protein